MLTIDTLGGGGGLACVKHLLASREFDSRTVRELIHQAHDPAMRQCHSRRPSAEFARSPAGTPRRLPPPQAAPHNAALKQGSRRQRSGLPGGGGGGNCHLLLKPKTVLAPFRWYPAVNGSKRLFLQKASILAKKHAQT